MTEPSEAFKAWHAKRAAEILKNADALATEYIKEGFSNSGSTRQIALFKAMELVDETGWDAWRDSREQALEEAAMAAEDGFKYDLNGYQIADKIRSLKS